MHHVCKSLVKPSIPVLLLTSEKQAVADTHTVMSAFSRCMLSSPPNSSMEYTGAIEPSRTNSLEVAVI
eukprot:1156717-Pelagomonas_calceolata.AAC.7